MPRHFITRLRTQLQARVMVFVYGYVCPRSLSGAGRRTVRQAEHDVDQGSEMSLSVRNAFVVPTDDLSHRANDKGSRYPQDHPYLVAGPENGLQILDALQEE